MRKQVWGTALSLLVALCCWYFYRDLRLDVTTKFKKVPDIVVHDVKVNKIINGRRWRISAPTVKTEDNILYGYNVDLTVSENNGRESHVIAKEGIFSQDYDQLTLVKAKGSMLSGKHSYDVALGKAEYNIKTRKWNFSDNLTLTDHEITVLGNTGSFNAENGNCHVKDRGKISWMEK